MLKGLVGAPNKGKSTIFSALTMKEVEIANYPFTTINPNMGIAYATKECVETELHVRCNARNSLCENGIRKLPVNIVDVAGLVEGAHEGKGMGNQFLGDLAAADALIIVTDASGNTDAFGNSCDGCSPSDDVAMVKKEIAEWIASIIKKHSSSLSKRTDGLIALEEILTGLKINREQIKSVLEKCGLSSVKIGWSDQDTLRFAKEILDTSKPIIIAANKSDVSGSDKNSIALKSEFADVIATSGSVELALRKAAKSGVIDYKHKEFSVIKGGLSEEQVKALDFMKKFIAQNGTNVQELVNRIVFDLLGNIVVYPVEDENKYTDHFGNVLPDAILIRKGSTALDLAQKIHTELAKNMLYAIDAKTKMRIGKDYILKDNDVIRIVSAAK